MTEERSHLRVQGEPPARWGAVRLLAPLIDAHRRPRGPYTFAAALLRHLAPSALRQAPELVAAHHIEILAAAPELADLLPAAPITSGADLSDEERILVPAPRRTLRLANGLAEFVRDAVHPGRAIAVCNADAADPTDTELLDVMIRRIPPATLTIMVYAGGPEPPPTPATPPSCGASSTAAPGKGSCTPSPSWGSRAWEPRRRAAPAGGASPSAPPPRSAGSAAPTRPAPSGTACAWSARTRPCTPPPRTAPPCSTPATPTPPAAT
ncbi:hypothetical protein [[Actinomadura] parvosata]|uniref:hypothetical protein n=1 Tax=[Actinomadura] parvosata TaxID=1955412 RepID=UPI001FECD25C